MRDIEENARGNGTSDVATAEGSEPVPVEA